MLFYQLWKLEVETISSDVNISFSVAFLFQYRWWILIEGGQGYVRGIYFQDIVLEGVDRAITIVREYDPSYTARWSNPNLLQVTTMFVSCIHNAGSVQVAVDGTSYHGPCFKCSHGGYVISPSNYVAREVCTASTITLSSSRQKGISARLANMNVLKR